jgi:hypothetical protein
MGNRKLIAIAKGTTDEDWRTLEIEIRRDFDNVQLWNKALDIFKQRMNVRYIESADAIENSCTISGEGFAISTILCSLMDVLETFYNGICYKCEKPRTNSEYGNGKSRFLIIEFLSKRRPFNEYFDRTLAEDFYLNVRCPLFHEAMTRNGWVIRIDTTSLVEVNSGNKILNRVRMLECFKTYIGNYRSIVLHSKERKNAFIRKMNCICNNS